MKQPIFLIDGKKLECFTEPPAIYLWTITQAFYDDNSVLFISIHQDSLYPLKSGPVTDIGVGKGEGNTLHSSSFLCFIFSLFFTAIHNWFLPKKQT